MGTQVLRPQDCLTHRIRISNKPVKQRFSPEKLTISKRSASAADLMHKQPQINNKNNLIVPKKVKILRRGESIKENEKKSDEEMEVRVGLPDVYAGSAVTMSPSPRALPVPSFFKKGGDVDDSATKDLRRLLRLD